MALADPIFAKPGPLHTESAWRQRPRAAAGDGLAMGRWTGAGPSSVACEAGEADTFRVVEIHLRPTDVALSIGGVRVHDGPIAAGSVLLTAGGQRLEAQYRAPCDLLHLFVPMPLFDAVAGDAPDGWDGHGFRAAGPDATIGRLALSLLSANDLQGRGAQLYAEGIAAAILARILSRSEPRPAGARPGGSGLVKWRLKRAVAFVDAKLGETITLPDLARAAGLSRMHFAAQFRAATGLRPHEFVVRRRIERAQELLRDRELPLAQVALSVGFQTQAHFTTVFREIVHETPGRWRQLHLAS
jgi:AraC-like DNA-binding protein